MAIKSLDELWKIREEHRGRVGLRHGEDYEGERILIQVGMATCGIAAGARETLNAITRELAGKGIREARVVPVGCIGYCDLEPIVVVSVPGTKTCAYGRVKKERVPEIVESHIIGKEPVERMLVDVDFDRI